MDLSYLIKDAPKNSVHVLDKIPAADIANDKPSWPSLGVSNCSSSVSRCTACCNLCSYLLRSDETPRIETTALPAYRGCIPGVSAQAQQLGSFRFRCRREKGRHSLAARQAALLKPATRRRSSARGVSASQPIEQPRNKTPQTEARDSCIHFSHSRIQIHCLPCRGQPSWRMDEAEMHRHLDLQDYSRVLLLRGHALILIPLLSNLLLPATDATTWLPARPHSWPRMALVRHEISRFERHLTSPRRFLSPFACSQPLKRPLPSRAQP